MKNEKLKRLPHIISGIVILLHSFERWEEEYPVYLLFLICGIVFLSVAIFHHQLSSRFPLVDTTFFAIEALLAFVIAYEYFEAGKGALPFVYLCAGLIQLFVLFFFARKNKLKHKKMDNSRRND